MIYFKCALLVSILFTLPVFLYQLWLFVKPGLTEEEARGPFLRATIIYSVTNRHFV